jgi:hypothetical protein
MQDRLGNPILAPGAAPVYSFAKGGGVDVAALLAQNSETLSDEEPEEGINTNPVGTAQKFLADLNSAGKASPTRQSIKRVKTSPGGGATADKAMQLAYEDLAKGDLGVMKDRPPAARNTESARSQMEELARIYQMKIRSAQESAKGLSANTFGAPTLEGATLTKGRLTKKRFAEGGEAKKSDVVGDIGKWLKNNDINPSDFLAALGRVSAVAGSALTPSTLNEGEDAELARRRTMPPTVTRAEGSPAEGEESLDQYYAPKARPSTGLNRKKGPISQALDSGEAYVNMAKGVTEMPYNLAGGPMDLVMLARQGLTGEAPAGQVGTSDYIKRKMTELGIRQEPPADPTAKGFYTAGDLLSNLANPAGVTRTGVKVAQKTGQAAGDAAKTLEDLTVGEVQRARVRKAGRKAQDIPDTAYDPLRERLEATGNLAYAVRPTGSTMLTGRRGVDDNVIPVSEMDRLLFNGMSNAGSVAGQNTGQANLIRDFWDKKARNYFTRQFGTPDDPVMEAIKTGRLKGSTLSSDLQLGFPAHLIDSLALGKTRYKEGATPEGFVGPGAPAAERFFPKYPEAVEDFTSRYDKATGLRGNLFTKDPAAADPGYDILSDEGRRMSQRAAELEAEKLLAQGVRPELANPEVGTITRSVKDPTRIVGEGTSSAKSMYDAFEEAVAPDKINKPGKTGLLNKIFGETAPAADAEAAKNVLPENVITAIKKGEPIYDISSMDKRLRTLFKPTSINEYLANLPPRELANIRFEDAVRGGLKLSERTSELENIFSRIKAGKPVADSVFSNGVSAPLMQFGKDSDFDGFAWKRIEKREATVPEGAYVGHSVGNYELGGIGYPKEKRDGFNTGHYQVYTLRDNRNRPVNTVEVRMLNEYTPVVMQIKGNGRASGNVPAKNYDRAVLDFFENYLRPSKIQESDDLLTPMLQKYKEELNASFKMP